MADETQAVPCLTFPSRARRSLAPLLIAGALDLAEGDVEGVVCCR